MQNVSSRTLAPRTGSSAPAPAGTYRHLRCHSVIEQETALPEWKQAYFQLQKGNFEGEVIRYTLPEVALMRETINLDTENHFLDSETHFGKGEEDVAFYLWVDPERRGQFRGGFSWCNLPGSCIFHGGAPLLLAIFPATAFRGQRMLDFAQGELEGAPSGSVASLANLINCLLEPDMGRANRANTQFARIVPNLLLDQVSALLDQPAVWRRNRPAKGTQMVRDLLDWLTRAPIEAVNVRDAAEGIGRRPDELKAACRAELDMPIERLLMIRRLNLVRYALLAGGAGVRVSDVALDHGFLHWGRFAAAYRGFFGELPSQTLARGQELSPGPHGPVHWRSAQGA